MNRIVLIGNGFDLAHGLETSYKSFIDNLWEEKLDKIQNDLDYVDDDIDIKGFEHPINIMRSGLIKSYDHLLDHNAERSINKGKLTVVFKNNFLEKITTKKQLTNWVDVENEYFEELLYLVKNDKGNKSAIQKLNEDFLSIKILLEKYISNEITKKKNHLLQNRGVFNMVYSYFKVEDFSRIGLEYFTNEIISKLDKIIEEVNNSNTTPNGQCHNDLLLSVTSKNELGKYILNKEKLLKLIHNQEKACHYLDFLPLNTLFLNFNYTQTESYYSQNQDYCFENKIDVNHIHGELNRKTNPIIFGYGDEIGKDYAMIEEANDNDLLENVKSIRYLDTDNYKKLLEYIDSEKYQIFIMGHSCGNSDRTLLNTLFENKNCVSIKVFYHHINENEDNYSDIIRNISRNFNDKKMMREKVVNKKYCSQLIK